MLNARSLVRLLVYCLSISCCFSASLAASTDTEIKDVLTTSTDITKSVVSDQLNSTNHTNGTSSTQSVQVQESKELKQHDQDHAHKVAAPESRASKTHLLKKTARKKLKKIQHKIKPMINVAVNEPNVTCGRVPIFEKLYHRSFNGSFAINGSADGDSGDFRILYGLDATPGEWPWVVRIQTCDGPECGFCTGSIINSRWVLTAGHCAFNRTDPANFKATIGQYDLLVPETSSYSASFDRVIVHPNYTTLSNDLTLLRLAKRLEFDEHVQPACLANANALKVSTGRKCAAIGYGLTVDMQDALKLQKLWIRARPPSECNSDQFNGLKLSPRTVCIGPEQGKIGGACKGDSGGPNQCYDPASDSWQLIATVSYGPADCDRDQGDKWLTVGVDVAKYRTWILATVKANSVD